MDYINENDIVAWSPVRFVDKDGKELHGVFCHHTIKNFAEFIYHKENFCNFAFGELTTNRM